MEVDRQSPTGLIFEFHSGVVCFLLILGLGLGSVAGLGFAFGFGIGNLKHI